MTSLQLDVDLGEGLVDPQAALHEAVVDQDPDHDDREDQHHHDDQRRVHGSLPVRAAADAASNQSSVTSRAVC